MGSGCIDDLVTQGKDAGEGTRRLTEVTVPYTTPYRYSKTYGWQSLAPPLYYGSVHWVETLAEGPPMAYDSGPWYRSYDEMDSSSDVQLFVPAIHLGVLSDAMFDPITPEIPYADKLIEVNLTMQTLLAYEYGKTVFQTNISSGIRGGGRSGDGLSTTTPNGKFTINDKYASKHMGYSFFSTSQGGKVSVSIDEDNYVLPGVPWTCFFTEVGHAFHGTYWHENFGTEMSHGCVNMRTNEANWIFRWAQPPHTTEAISNHTRIGTKVEIHY